MELTLEEAVKQAYEAKYKWVAALMNVAVKHYEYKTKKRLGRLHFLLDADSFLQDEPSGRVRPGQSE